MTTLFRRWHWLIVPMALFAIFESIAALFMHQQVDPSTDALPIPMANDAVPKVTHTNLLGTQWDDAYYRDIAVNGYPDELPRSEDGEVEPNSWAFYPLYPMLVRGVMTITTLPFASAGMLLSVLLTLGALVLLYRWVHAYSGRRWAAALAVGSILAAPSSLVFQAAYTEGLTLFLLVLFLRLLSSGRYLTAIPVVLALSFTRNIVPPLLMVGLLVGIHNWWQAHKAGLTTRKALGLHRAAVVRYFTLGVATFMSAFLWVAVVGVATGVPTGYFDTYRAWTGGESTIGWWLTKAPLSSTHVYPYGTLAILVPVMLVALFMAFKSSSDYPLVLRLMPVSMATYVFAVTNMGGSEWRYFLLGFFLFPFTRVPSSTKGRVIYFGCLGILLLLVLISTYWWVGNRWLITPNSGYYVAAP